MRSVTVDLTQAKSFGRMVEQLPKKAFVHAMRNAVNNTAVQARTDYVSEARMSMQMRNDFTPRSIQFDLARGVDVSKMQARVGSTVPWMAEREEAQTVTGRGKEGFALPTPAAAGQAGAGVRTKPLRRGNYMGNLKLQKRVTPKNATGGEAQKTAVAIRMALKSGLKTAFLELMGRKPGMYRISAQSSARRGRSGPVMASGRFKSKQARLVMLYDQSERTLHTKANPMLERVVKMAEQTMPIHCERALADQLKRVQMKSR